jgi:cell division protein FtsI (penicillin-binding protein 3)
MIEINLFYVEKNRYFVSSIDDERRNILDRNNISLTANLQMSDVGIDPKKIYDRESFIKKVSSLYYDISANDLENRINSGKWFYLKRNISPNELQKVIDLGETGIEIKDIYKRKYLHKELFSHLIGKVDIDNDGVSGMEKSFNASLNNQNESDVISSVDTRIQHIVRDEILDSMKLYKATGGSGLVMEVNTGEILSMVSLPDFDPNSKNFDENSTFNKNTLGVYEFGSVMKIFTTAIGIEENIFKPNTLYEIDDHIYIDKHKVHDVHRPCETKKCTVEEIFVHSSNVGTIKMIRDIGPDLQKKYLLDLGLLNQVIINLPERAEPLVPDPWTMASTESISYGYGLSISPLHLALATSTVLNGGYIIEPSLIKKDNQLFKNQIFSEQTSEIMRYLLNRVVDKGTAKDAFGKESSKQFVGKDSDYRYLVGGKTGTAEKISNKAYSSDKLTTFISSFPINKPKYLVLVSLDNPEGVIGEYDTPYNTWGYSDAGWNVARTSRLIIDRISPILDTKSKYLPSDNLLINTSLQ